MARTIATGGMGEGNVRTKRRTDGAGRGWPVGMVFRNAPGWPDGHKTRPGTLSAIILGVGGGAIEAVGPYGRAGSMRLGVRR